MRTRPGSARALSHKRVGLGFAILMTLACPVAAHAVAAGSPLALALMGGEERPQLIFAQRTIDRTWGPEDSSRVIARDPESRSEILALSMSALLPGAGQAYLGEGSGVWFAIAEAAGWTAKILIRKRAVDLHDEARQFLGVPTDTSGAWSFDRWAAATGGDPQTLRQLYQVDPDAFYRLIGSDDGYLQGWNGNAINTRADFESLRERSDVQFGRARVAGMALWLNHFVSAADALRAARIHNIPLERNLELHVKTSWRQGSPGLVASVERRF